MLTPTTLVAPSVPAYTADELAGILNRGESVEVNRLASSLVFTMQAAEQITHWVNMQRDADSLTKKRAASQGDRPK